MSKATTDKAQDAEPKRVVVTLKQPHRHRGEDLQPGAEIEVTPRQVEFLRAQGVIA